MGSLLQNPRDIEPLISPRDAANAAPPLIKPAGITNPDPTDHIQEQTDEWTIDAKRGVFSSGPHKGKPIAAVRNALAREFNEGAPRPKPGTPSTIASQSPTMALSKTKWNETFKKPSAMNPAMSGAEASTAQMRTAGAAKDAAAVRVAVAPQPAAPMRVTDMRPANQRASADGNPHGLAYLNQLGEVFKEQGAAERNERETGNAGDASKKGRFYAEDEAERRAGQIANPSLAELPGNTRAAVLTDPKYGGGGVGYATNGAGPSPRDAWAGSAGVREINSQIARGLPAPAIKMPTAPAPKMQGPSPINPALGPDKEPVRKPSDLNRAFVSK